MIAPDSEKGVLDVLRGARAEGRRVRLSGHGVSAAPARDGAIPLSLSGVRGILDLRPSDLVVTVRAGTPLAEIDAALREVGRRLPLRPWSPVGRGTIGGAVAAAADGLLARDGLRWRDHVLGATLALSSGEIARVGASVVKSVAGFDACKAIVGSGGVFAAILSLDLRIEDVSDGSLAVSREIGREDDVAALVAHLGGVESTLRACAVTPLDGSGAARVDVLLEGGASALGRARAALATVGFREVATAEACWADLTESASAPPPAGAWRRLAPVRRTSPLARVGAEGSPPAWLVDLPRQRRTWIASSPPPPGDAASAALLERVRRAFDPDGLFQARGAPDPT